VHADDTHALSAADRDARIMQVLDAYLRARERGTAGPPDELLAAHPDLAADLRAHLALVDHMVPPAQSLEHLIRAGILTRSDDGTTYLQHYRIRRLLGRGGMGIVLEGSDPQLKRSVALKVLRPDLTGDTAVLARFEREARAAATLQHPGIVTVYAVGRAGDTPFIAMEYVDGPSLATYLAAPHSVASVRTHAASAGGAPTVACATMQLPEGPDLRSVLPAACIPRLTRELLAALDAAHNAGIIHRDIKPSNILLTPAGRTFLDAGGSDAAVADSAATPLIKLADFGLARLHTAQTQLTLTQAAIGTPAYMSPEQARGDRDIDARTDLYSAGIVLYELLTGVTPFQAATPTATLHRILYEPARDPRRSVTHADPHLARLALHLIEKDPTQRCPTARAALDTLDGIRRVPWRPRWRWSHLGLVTAAATAALVAITAMLTGGLRPAAAPRDALRSVHIRDNQVLYNSSANATFRPLVAFPAHVRVRSAIPLRPTPAAEPIIAVGISAPFEQANLFIYDIDGALLRTAYLHDESGRTWPDCAAPQDWFINTIAAGNIDDAPGDELIIAASEMDQYASFVAVVDPRTLMPRDRFWHTGAVNHLSIAAGALPDGRPGITAVGLNNKLDGFGADDEPIDMQPGDAAPVTGWDRVAVLFVLDPERMAGVGPPATTRLAAWGPPAMPFAYTFLDLPAHETPARRAGTLCHQNITPSMLFGVCAIHRAAQDRPGHPSPCYRVEMWHTDPDVGGSPRVLVDGNLHLLADQVVPTPYGPLPDAATWTAVWIPLVTNYEYDPSHACE
jgi:serine/threonine protein kinase